MSEWQDGNMGGIQPVELFASMLASLDDETSEVRRQTVAADLGAATRSQFPAER
jgi:hypothetical protein